MSFWLVGDEYLGGGIWGTGDQENYRLRSKVISIKIQ